MDAYKREYFLSRILAGYLRYTVGHKVLRIYSPNRDIIYRANEIYFNTYNLAINNGIMTDKDVYNMMIDKKLWTETDEKNLSDVLPQHIDYWKEQLYLALFKNKERENIRKYLKAAKDELVRLYNIRHSFDYATCHGIAQYAKLQFIVEKSTYTTTNKRYNWYKSSPYLAMLHYQQNTIDELVIRELSHNSPWDAIWSAGKYAGQLFDRPAVDLSPEQQRLIVWSSLYDNVRESSECPPDDVLDDDDMLDGWLIIQRKERESQLNRIRGESLLTNEKISKAGEVYVPADSIEDANKIDMLNTANARNIKKQRFKTIEKYGQVNEASLPDIKQELSMELNRLMSQSVKKG